MRIFTLTKLGAEVARTGAKGDAEEIRILNHLYNHREASEDELEVVSADSRVVTRKLVRRGLVKELTT